MTNETYVIGPSSLMVSPLAQVPAVDGPFVALVPASDLLRLPATLDALTSLLHAGCEDLILAGPRADAFQEQVGFVIEQEGVGTALSTFPDYNDACNAALLSALVRKTGLALCADEPEMLETLRGAAQMNGWTKSQAEPVKAKPAAKSIPTKKPVAKAKPAVKAKAKPAPKKPAAKPKAKSKSKRR